MTSRAAVKNAVHRKRRREKAMGASELGSAMTPLNDDDDEFTITDLAAGGDGPGEIPVDSIVEDVVEETEPEETVLERAVKEAVNLLKEIKKLKTSEEVRAALPAAPLLGEKMVWITKRVRALAMKCGFDPPLGMTRMVLLQMIEDFRLGLEGGVLGDELVQGDAPPAPVVLDGEECGDEVGLARFRAQEEEELLRLIAESERDNERAAGFAAAKKRKMCGVGQVHKSFYVGMVCVPSTKSVRRVGSSPPCSAYGCLSFDAR